MRTDSIPNIKNLKDAQSLDINDILALRRLSNEGNIKAQVQLSRAAVLLAKEANRRLAALERRGMTLYAYDYAMTYTRLNDERKRFTGVLKKPDDLYGEVLAMQNFLSKETSTVKGYQEVEERRKEAFRAKMGITESDMSDQKLSDFFRLLGKTPIRRLLKEQDSFGSQKLVELFRNFWEVRKNATREIEALVKQMQETEEAIKGGFDPPENAVYYDEMIKYLKKGESDKIKYRRGKISRL